MVKHERPEFKPVELAPAVGLPVVTETRFAIEKDGLIVWVFPSTTIFPEVNQAARALRANVVEIKVKVSYEIIAEARAYKDYETLRMDQFR